VDYDAPRDVMVLDTARRAGGCGPEGETIRTAAATVTLDKSFATVWVSSLDAQPIRDSKRLEKIATKAERGELVVKLQVAGPDGKARLAYEIVAEEISYGEKSQSGRKGPARRVVSRLQKTQHGGDDLSGFEAVLR
jgi:hypothetical protein